MARAGLQPLEVDQRIVVTLDREGLGRALEPARPHGDLACRICLDPDGCPIFLDTSQDRPEDETGR